MFSTDLIRLGFTLSTSDPSLFILHQNDNHIYLLLYVDDILVTGNSSSFISHILQQLHTKFNLKILGPIHHFLGIQVQNNSSDLLLTQAQYASSILQKSGMQDCKPITNPLPSKPFGPLLPSTPNPSLSDPHTYRQIVGALQYLTITRPDIQFAVNHLCQFLHQPTTYHFQLLKRLLRYIKGTLHFALPIQPTSLSMYTYSDANWANDPTDRRSTFGHYSFLGSNLISWQVKKQPTVAKSSTEAEYSSLAAAATDIIWLRRLLAEFQISITQPTSLYCDNISAMALANNPAFHARTKHIEIDYHFIRERIKSKEI